MRSNRDVRRRAAARAGLLAVVLLLLSCQPQGPSNERGFADRDRELFVINNLAETVSVYHPESGTLHNDVFAVGRWPNDLLFYDDRLFVVESGDNAVSVYDESSFAKLDEIYLGPGRNPYSIVGEPTSAEPRAFVVNSVAETVSVVDLDAAEVTATIADDAHLDAPQDGAVMGGYLFVCNTAHRGESSFGVGSVSVFEATAPYAFVTGFETGDESNPQTALALPGKAELHVYLTGSHEADDGEVLVLDTSGLGSGGGLSQVTRLAIGGSPSLSGSGYDASSGMVYLTGTYGLYRYDAATNTLPDTPDNPILPTGDPSEDLFAGIAVDAATELLVAADFSGDRLVVLDANTFDRLDTLEASDGPFAPYLTVE
jgi:DNA-binding beta-propeller fold protein YncE